MSESLPEKLAIAADAPVLDPNAPLEAPRKNGFADRLALALSAILSPYIVIPVGTIGLIWARSSGGQFWLWVAISLGFSTFSPVLYILWGMKRGFISDIHVMERDQRGAPFAVAIVGATVAALILARIGAPASVWGLSVIVAVNGLVILGITYFTKISVHVSVLSSMVIGATIMHPGIPAWSLIWMIPLLIWARLKRGRHSIWQGLGGCVVASVLTTGIIAAIGLDERLPEFLNRLMPTL